MRDVASSPPAAAVTKHPARVLGPLDATCVVIGAIIGVGIFFTPAKIAALAGTPSLVLLTWGAAGFIALCGALAFAELGGRYHASGAQYQALRDAWGPLPAFLFVFCNATAIQAGAIGIIALICAQNLAIAVQPGEAAPGGAVQMAIAVTLIAVLALANVLGARWGSRIQNLTVAAKLLTLLAMMALALFAAPQGEQHAVVASSVDAHDGVKLGVVAALFAGLVPALFSFGGWQQALWISGEVKEPRRNLPRAILVGVTVVVAVYLLANWAYLSMLGVGGMAASDALAADAVAAGMPNAPQTGRRIIAGAVAVSAFGVLNSQLLAGPRLIFGMACDGRFFRPFASLSPRCGTPMAAIVLLAGMAIALMLAAGFNGLDRLLTGVVFIDCVFMALTGGAVLVLRRKQRAGERTGMMVAEGSFRVPGGAVIPMLFVLAELGALVGALLDPTVRSAALIGVGWIVGAAVVYAMWFRSRRAALGAG